jgi:NADPH-dependent 2,4-dienoyl-CoA reductase/sulfur reductase-like enzyme/peroxiredoxin family protein/TusA-related sulfurtransferase/rhodanese-related sulfurtransferase
MSKILIVGGVAGGATAATRLRRLSEKDEIIIIERSGYVSFANCGLPYYLGGVIKERERLLQETPETLKAKFNLDVRIHQEVVAINREKQSVAIQKEDGTSYEETYDDLILSMGASPRKIPLEGLAEAKNVFFLRNMEDVDAISSALNLGAKKALVVGGGFIGIEVAENLVARGLEVTLVEGRNQILPPFDPEMAKFLENELVLHGVALKLGVQVTRFEDSGKTVILSNGESLGSDLTVLSLGVSPENTLAKSAHLALSPSGYVLTSPKMEVYDEQSKAVVPHLYCIGDLAEVKDPLSEGTAHIALAGPANREARLVADVLHDLPYSYKGALGTSVIKVFDQTGAATGYSEALCDKKGRAHQSVMIERNQHAGYYPGASLLTLKVVFDPKDGTLLGAQAVGHDGVEKRIDVIATAIAGGLKVQDLMDLELSYAPPYGSAKDPINIVGYAASNLLRGDYKQISLAEVAEASKDALLVDARTPMEYQIEHMEGAVNIPFVTLRQNLDKLPQDKNAKIVVYCNVGLTAYLWICLARGEGYTNLINVEGGMRLKKTIEAPLTVSQSTAFKGGNIAMDTPKNSEPMIEVDATGLQCPGPIMEASKASEKMQPGQRMKIIASDCGFASDIDLWAKTTGNTVVSNENQGGKIVAVVEKGQPMQSNLSGTPNNGGTTIVLFSGDMDKALAAMIIAQGTRAMGKPATVFCTFWGLNLLRKPKAPRVKKSLIERMFGWMMPKGAKKFKLSKMNMMGMGSKMMRGVMKKKNVPVLEEQLANAQKAGVRFLACTMSMDIMGIKKEELIDGIDYVGVATYLAECQKAATTLFI